MSLINDALKRAKAVQPPPPPVQTELHLRPAEAQPRLRHGVGYAVPIGFFCLALLILFFVWRYSQQNPTQDPPRSNQALANAHESSSKPASSLPTDGVQVRAREREPVSAPEAKPATAPSGPVVPSASGTTIAQTNNVAPSVGGTPSSNAVAVAVTSVPAAPAAPPPPKLQGVIYNPRRPSAVISGKVLFIGDRFGTSRVAAISPNSVTLIGAGQTNVLTMEE